MHAYLSVDIRTRACFALSGLLATAPQAIERALLAAHAAPLPQGVHFDFHVGDEDHIEWSSM